MACGILDFWELSSLMRVEPGPQQWRCQVLITGLPGNAPNFSFYILAPHQPPRGSFLRAAERLFPGLSFHSVLSKLLGWNFSHNFYTLSPGIVNCWQEAFWPNQHLALLRGNSHRNDPVWSCFSLLWFPHWPLQGPSSSALLIQVWSKDQQEWALPRSLLEGENLQNCWIRNFILTISPSALEAATEFFLVLINPLVRLQRKNKAREYTVYLFNTTDCWPQAWHRFFPLTTHSFNKYLGGK